MGASRTALAVLPALPNTVQQWNKIAEDTVVGSGAFQGEGEVYMSYTATAVYDAVVAIEGGYEPYGPGVSAAAGASVDCAVVEAAYRTLLHYFQSNATLVTNLNGYYSDALSHLNGCTADGGEGTSVGSAAANSIIALRTGDGRMTPIAYDVAVRDEEPRPRSVASYSTIRRPTDAVARVGATVSAEEPWSVSNGAAASTYEPAVGSGIQRG